MTAEPASVPALRIGVLGLGNGSTAAALIEAVERGVLPAGIAVVAARSGSGPLAVARAHGVTAADLGKAGTVSDADRHAAILAAFERERVDLVVLAGEPSELGPAVLERFAGRVLSARPVPPVALSGRREHSERLYEAILESGVRICGASVNVMTADGGDGIVLWHAEVEVRSSDSVASLRARLRATERHALVEYLRFAAHAWRRSGALPRDPELDDPAHDDPELDDQADSDPATS